jgi:hypothetical protein
VAIHYKVCIDCQDPHRLAEFWAEALGFVIEDNSALIQRLLDDGIVEAELAIEVNGRYAWRDAVAIRDPEGPVDPLSGIGHGRRILFQAVPEPKVGKNRMHLDLHVGKDQIDAEVERLRKLGASVVGERRQGPNRWVTMTDPEGNEFCVA